MAKVVKKTQCPSCSDRGNDTARDNLAVYTDGSKFCFACGYFENNGVVSKDKSKKVVKLPEFTAKLAGIPNKRIGAVVCDKYGVVEEVEEEVRTGRRKDYVSTGYVVLPYYNYHQKLVGVKYRDFDATVKDILFEGEVDFFGWQTYSTDYTEVCLWEGESDTLTAAQLDNTRLHLGYPGVQTLKNTIKKNWDALAQFDRIYFCADNDEQGEKAREIVNELLPYYKLWHVTVPDAKDINEAVSRGQKDFYIPMMRDAKQHGFDLLLTGDELQKDFVTYTDNHGTYDFMSTGLPNVDLLLGGGITRGEVLLIAGHTGRGKSTYTIGICHALSRARTKALWVGTEMLPRLNTRKFIEASVGRRYLIGKDCTSITNEERDKALDELKENIVFFNNVAPVFEEVEQAVISAVHRYDISVVFIDVLQDIDPNFSDWQRAADIMKRINTLAQGDIKEKRPPIGFVLVSHTLNEAEAVHLGNIRGGGAIRQKATCVLSFEGDVHDNVRKIKLLKKSRLNDSEYAEAYVAFDVETRRYIETECPGEEEEPEENIHAKQIRSKLTELSRRKRIPLRENKGLPRKNTHS